MLAALGVETTGCDSQFSDATRGLRRARQDEGIVLLSDEDKRGRFRGGVEETKASADAGDSDLLGIFAVLSPDTNSSFVLEATTEVPPCGLEGSEKPLQGEGVMGAPQEGVLEGGGGPSTQIATQLISSRFAPFRMAGSPSCCIGT